MERTSNDILRDIQFLDSKAESSKLLVGTDTSWWSVTNAMTMCFSLLLFCVIILGMVTYLMKSEKESPEAILRIFGTILIIFITVFLVVAGYNDQQIAPATGLLGTIAGYLLGKEPKRG
jgi:membrane-associated HD superfamily phosphohydrolase